MAEDPLASASPSITKHIDDLIFARKYRVAELVRAIEKMDEVDDNDLASDEEVKELDDLEKKIRDHEGIFKEELSNLEDAKSKDIWFMAIVLPLPIFGMFILDFNLFLYESIPVCLHILYNGPVITLIYAIATLIHYNVSWKGKNSEKLEKPINPDVLGDWEHTITTADVRHRQLEILKIFKKLRCGIVGHKIWIFLWNFCGYFLLFFATVLRSYKIYRRTEAGQELEPFNFLFFCLFVFYFYLKFLFIGPLSTIIGFSLRNLIEVVMVFAVRIDKGNGLHLVTS